MRIAHLSDLHFGRAASDLKLEALTRDLREQNVDLLIVTGDITDRGTISQFRSARRWFRSLGLPFLTVPGNREICPTAFWEWLIPSFGMRRYSRFFGLSDRVVCVNEEHKVVLFGLNSVHPFPSFLGSIRRDTRYWLRSQSAAFPGYMKGLFLHHPVLPVVGSSTFWAHGLADASEMINIATMNGISVIFQGHKHRTAVMEFHLPERQKRIVISAAGAPLVERGDAVFHVVTLRPGFVSIERRELNGSAFENKDRHDFPMHECAHVPAYESRARKTGVASLGPGSL